MNQNNKPLFDGMKAIAFTYKNSAELLDVTNSLIKAGAQLQGVKNPNNNEPLQFDQVIISKIVLYGICVEISLKAIILFETDYVERSKHDWTILYKMLPDNVKNAIKQRLATVHQADFDNLLEQNKNTFIKWRYCYEGNLTCDLSFVQDFANAVTDELLTR